MSTFAQAVQAPAPTFTTNGMPALTHTGDALTNLFFAIGASRGKDISVQFEKAFQEDASLALKILFWVRDVRQGAGERDLFRNVLQYLEANHPDEIYPLIKFIPEFGRWDDVFCFKTPKFKMSVYDLVTKTLMSGRVDQNITAQTCAKWCDRKGPIANELRKYMNLTPKAYRKLIVGLTKVVENFMCAKEWTDINYSHVPSQAASRYQKAFKKHDPSGYATYKEGLATGETKVNAGAIYPYDVIRNMHMDQVVSTAQWNCLPNYLGNDFILPMVDVSGSMTCPAGGKGSMTCMDVAVSLGLYLADKQSGAFKDMFLTFHSNSKIETLKGSIVDKLNQLRHADWGGSTSLESAFREILRVATSGNVPESEMPKYMVILSDMQMNLAVRDPNLNSLALAKKMFETAGYTIPKIVYWNINANDNVPVKFDENGTALISGFSPSIMKSVLSAKSFTPYDIMMETIGSSRYSNIKV
jgi:hypothetical protein